MKHYRAHRLAGGGVAPRHHPGRPGRIFEQVEAGGGPVQAAGAEAEWGQD